MAAGLFGLATAHAASAATLPYSNNFDSATLGTTLPSDFIESVGAAGSVANYNIITSGGGRALQANLSASNNSTTTGTAANVSAAVQFPGAAGSDFVVSTDFVLDNFNTAAGASTLNFGLAAAGSVANFSSGNQYRLIYTVFGGNSSRLAISENGTIRATSTGTIAPTAGFSGTMTLTGVYSGGALDLTGTLVSGPTTLTVSFQDTTTPFTGEYFGYRTALNALLGSTQTGPLTASQDVTYDNFSVAVPEPTTAAAGGLMMLGLLARRRRA
jgi:hypothetical protein